ncbi:tripartite tricarboxylate transporter substrate binding protein [Pigmentiphaga sp. YJ18]|uniref:tripartite tricarboxylate transporter substrate binding protein n=1 Tax=Pigmentiphaga sp. YJ18 TaxID=3134907 RepID=UPI00311106CB
MNVRRQTAKGWLCAIGMSTLAIAHAASATADEFPDKPVEMTVPFPAGSSADVVARVLADGMSRQLGQPVTVMNRPGAGSAIGYKYVQARKPDGYSIVFNSNSISTAYYQGLVPFDYKAFDPVARVSVELPVVAVKADAPWNSLRDLVADAKKRPGEIRLGNSGFGSHTHTSAVAFFHETRAEVTHVAFGASQVVTSLIGGHIDALVQLPGALTAHVKAGTLKVLGVMGSNREPAFPHVPTAREQGFDFQADMWRGIAVPKGTPAPVVARLEAAVRKAVESAEFKTQGEKLGFVPAFQSAPDFGHTIATEDVLLAKLMTDVGLRKTPEPQAKF